MGTSLFTNSAGEVTAVALSASSIKITWDTPATYPTSEVTMTSGSGSGTTITVASTTGLKVGQLVSVIAGTGAFPLNTVVTSITSSTVFTVNFTPSTGLSSATVYAYTAPYKTLRLVRNQQAFSETQEDGAVLYEFVNDPFLGDFVINTFTDGVDSTSSYTPLISGRYAYYTVWLLLEDSWVIGGKASVLLPKPHNDMILNTKVLKTSHDKFMDVLPKIYTTVDNTSTGALDTSSDLYKFLKAFSLTYDEILTLADLSIQQNTNRYMPDNIVQVATAAIGLRNTSTLATSYKKDLISKASSLFLRKGGADTLQSFVQTFTGYTTTVSSTISSGTKLGLYNLLLNPQDSSFHKGGLGNWKAVYGSGGTSNITLIAEGSSDIVKTEKYSLQSPYRLQVVAGADALGEWRLGSSTPKTTDNAATEIENLGYGIPVEPGTSYTFSFYAKVAATTGTIYPYIKWCDAYGKALSTDATSNTISLNTTWTKKSYTKTSPGYSVTANGYTATGTTVTITGLPSTHTFDSTTNNKIWIESNLVPFTGLFTITSYTSTSITFNYKYYEQSLTNVTSSGTTFTFTGLGNTAFLLPTQPVVITSGGGALNGVTRIVSITNDNTFVVDVAPTTNLSGSSTIGVGLPTSVASFKVYKANSANTGKETEARFAMLGFTQTEGAKSYYLDAIQFNPGAVSDFIEPRSVDIYVDPNKINYLVDPTFMGSGWSYAGGASSPAGYSNLEATTLMGIPYVSTSKMGKIITGSSNSTAAAPDLKTTSPTPITNNNTYYTFSIYIKGDAAYSLTLGLTDGVNSKEKVINVTTSWQRVYVTLYVTSISTGLTPYIYSNSATPSTVNGEAVGNGARSSAQTFRVDDAQLEESRILTDYFDGDFANQGAFWSGSQYASKSYLYVNKNQKLSELAVHINDWVPLNTVWMVRSALGIEAIGVPSSSTTSSADPYTGGGGGGGNVVYT